MQRRISDTKKSLIDNIVKHARKRSANKGIGYSNYLRQYFRSVAAEDLLDRSVAELDAIAAMHLKAAHKRAENEIIIQIVSPDEDHPDLPSDRTMLQTVCDDMSFVIDTITMVITDMGLVVNQTIHPILHVRRGKTRNLREIVAEDAAGRNASMESFAHFELDRIGDERKLAQLHRRIEQALSDVQACTRDWQSMRSKALTIANEIRTTNSPVRVKDREETAALLEWMADDHFTFLGYREYVVDDSGEKALLKPRNRTGLGVLSKASKPSPAANDSVQKAIVRQISSRSPLIITKANRRSTVHRHVHMDYIGVKRFNENGKAYLEQRFLGLFASAAYNRSPRDIPYLRRKVVKVIDSFALPDHSHAKKALMHILEAYPRDELFQSSVEDLRRISEGVLALQERSRVKLFVRRDPYRRFIACMIYVPKEKYNTDVRGRIEKILMKGFHGEAIESKVLISESALARLQCRVTTSPEHGARSNLEKIQKDIAEAVQTWVGGLRDELMSRLGHNEGARLFDLYGSSFSAAYQEDFSPYEATFDVERVAKVDGGGDIQMALYRPPSFASDYLRFKIFQKDQPIPISDVLPMLENMGMRVISERPYRCRVGDHRRIYVQEFEMQVNSDRILNPADIGQRFQDTFEHTWRGDIDSDGFNTLVIDADLTWREAALLRAYSRYLMQTGLPFSQPYIEEVFRKNSKFAQLWIRAFTTKFSLDVNDRQRKSRGRKLHKDLRALINTVASADEDRIFRAFLAALSATLRTNYYLEDEDGEPMPYLSFKFDPTRIPGLPKPLPMYEVFVYSARMEGVHLRGGPIARGGIRWSDRREDFRTEILGLMKAQKVKNTVIVPTGAKGGFVCKKLPDGDRDEIQKEVIACYRTLICGLLDITDNLVKEKIKQPKMVVRHDDDDPYLVVAADKGTATFSDIANGIAQEYGFWMDDAFASGGSVGYDHKGMGITAKGAWEAVKRHFRELGIDTQNDEFTVAGIGDMGGDVFGNGMLRSETMKLQAAFNHMHIFLDPEPHAAKTFKERERLFKLPRSSWEDFNSKLISKGGGVYSRANKTLKLSKAARNMLDLNEKGDPTPNEVMRAILKMRVDLLWNGGIGTYVKAQSESHREAGDRSNDAVRINGGELRCRVIGEGGNLGFTQLGRIEFALNDGKVNTDFIDNAGGVDCSDREVNIKILLNLAANKTKLPLPKRNKLLASMTDEVEELVLRDNYFQTQAISILESDSVARATEHMRFIRLLEENGELDRELEYLPSDSEILERQQADKGLTRPELSILVSYSKINLINQLNESKELNNEFAYEDLQHYFPTPLQKQYANLMRDHRLAHEIIATQTAGSLVNRMGPTYVIRTQEETGASAGEIARAYTIARETLNLRPLWRSVEGLDNDVQARAQYRMLAETARLLRRASIWLLQRPQFANDTKHAINTFAPAISNLSKNLSGMLRGPELEQFRASRDIYTELGVTRSVAQKMAGIRYLYSGYDIAQAATQLKRDDEFVANVYFRLSRGLQTTWLSEQIENLAVRGRWQALARGTLREGLYEIKRAATILAVKASKSKNDKVVAENWLKDNALAISRANRVVTDMRSMGSMDFATLSVALQEMRKLVMD